MAQPSESSGERRARLRAARASRPAPSLDPAFRALDVAAVRAAVAALDRELQDAAYWRRVLDARRASVLARSPALPGGGSDLSPRLIEARPPAVMARIGRIDGRAVRDAAPFDLPDLVEPWQRPLPEDESGRDALIRELSAAAGAVERYAVEIRRRYDDARAELVARYRDNPSVALDLLPDNLAPP